MLKRFLYCRKELIEERIVQFAHFLLRPGRSFSNFADIRIPWEREVHLAVVTLRERGYEVFPEHLGPQVGAVRVGNRSFTGTEYKLLFLTSAYWLPTRKNKELLYNVKTKSTVVPTYVVVVDHRELFFSDSSKELCHSTHSPEARMARDRA